MSHETGSGSFLDHLKQAEILTDSAAKRVLGASTKSGVSIATTILELGLADESGLFKALADYNELPFFTKTELAQRVLENSSLPPRFQKRREVLLLREDSGSLALATASPEDTELIDSITYFLNEPIGLIIAAPSSIKAVLASTQTTLVEEGTVASETDLERLMALANEGPVIKLVNELIAKAIDARASDIHFETTDAGMRVRFRIDGTLVDDILLSDGTRAAVASRLKVMARLNISEKRRPQDGRTQVSMKGRRIDIRLSTLPTQFGESLVLRLLDRGRLKLNWAELGFTRRRIKNIRDAIAQPNGMFLVAGPTGSGKTTTLYTALSELNSVERKIVTVEDPIEYSLPGINQVQVEPEINMSFAQGLRSILRQDPDIIMVGEIRDAETAEIAIRAALVGRMVLTTIHTNDAIAAITRLRDLGIPSYLLGSTLRGVLSQRLLRLNCQKCSGSGCDVCNETGYLGRTVVSEFLSVNRQISDAISRDVSGEELLNIVTTAGFTPLLEVANAMVEDGYLCKHEVERTISALSEHISS